MNNNIERIASLKELAAGALVYFLDTSLIDSNRKSFYYLKNEALYDKFQEIRKKAGDDIAKLLVGIRRCGSCHQFRNWEKVGGGVIIETSTTIMTRCSLCLSSIKEGQRNLLSELSDRMQREWGKRDEHKENQLGTSHN